MLVLRCTTKAFRKLGCRPQAVTVSDTQPNLGDWYVNTIDYLNAGDLMMACMHVESLFIIMVPLQADMSREDFTHAFLASLLTRLAGLEAPPDIAGSILAAYGGSAVLAKNTDRRVAGHLNSALGDLDCLLGIPRLKLADGKRINIARVEHCLNGTPRGCSGNHTIWPLDEFWRCLRRLRPDLPPRTTLSIAMFHPDQLALHEDVLREHLPSDLVDKFLTSLAGFDVLYATDELRALIRACAENGPLQRVLPDFADEMHRLTSFRLRRLLKDDPT